MDIKVKILVCNIPYPSHTRGQIKDELLTLWHHLGLPPVIDGVRVAHNVCFLCCSFVYCLSYPCVLFVVSLCLICRIPVSCLSYPCVLFVVSLCLVCRIPVSCLSYPCAWFVVSLCLVCPMLSVSLCCLFWVPHRFSRTFILNLWGSSQPIFSHGFDIIFHTFVFNRARVQNKQLFSCIMTMMRLIMMFALH